MKRTVLLLRKHMWVYEMKSIYPTRFLCSSQFCFGAAFDISFDLSQSIVSIGDQVQFRDFCLVRSGNNGKLKIASNNFFNSGCSINCFFEISIGENCQFGEGVKFYDHDHQYKDKNTKINTQGYSFGSIKVGQNCWFGSNVIILKGVTIGDNVVIGAGCIIHKDVPSNAVIVNKQSLVPLT